MKKIISVVTAAALALFATAAIADYTIKDGAGATQTILSFVCQTTKICPAHVLIKSDGTEIGTTSNPVVTDIPTGGTLYNALTTANPCLNSTAPTTNSYTNGQTNPMNCNLNGGQRVEPFTPRNTLTIAGCTVGVTNAQCLASNTAIAWVQVQNTHASNSVACSWGGTSILNNSGSFQLAAGQSASWGPNTGGVPSGAALNCIASGASTPLYVEYR
jgi:hypothetical protein